jgi:hypothetical protein
MTAEGLGKRLAPELSLTDEALPYLAEALGVAAAGRTDQRERLPGDVMICTNTRRLVRDATE